MRVTEETLEQEIAPLLAEWLGGEHLTQTYAEGQKPDVIIIVDKRRLVFELEIDGRSKLLEGVIQANSHKEKVKADGVIALAYPGDARREIVSRQDVIDIATGLPITAIVLTPFLNKRFADINLRELAEGIRDFLPQPTPTVDLGLVTGVLREAVLTISMKLRYQHDVAQPALDAVINQFELFQVLSAGEDGAQNEERQRDLMITVCDLVGYVLVNQLLLYHLLAPVLDEPTLNTVSEPRALAEYFARITERDYEAVYGVDVISKLSKDTAPEVNSIILGLRAVQPQYVPHDLLGRIFHEFLPPETRKLLGAFYTKPVAAEILAGLAVKKADDVVMDPACGSGTLLVSAYRSKRIKDPRRTHKRIIEDDVYGVDIMPFAAHLAALNLTMQGLTSITDRVNVGMGNSLDLQPGTSVTAQLTLPFAEMRAERVDMQDLSAEAGAFDLPQSTDVVIMNPPFTIRRRLTPQMLGTRKDAFPSAQNYWAYFLALADDLLREGGLVAAVLPRLFLAGHYSADVREKLIAERGYTLRYVVRTTREIAFSEKARFRDFLIVMGKERTECPCGVIYLKRSLEEMTVESARGLAAKILEVPDGQVYTDDEISVEWVPQHVVRQNTSNLLFLVAFENPENAAILRRYGELVLDRAGDKLVKLRDCESVKIRRGMEPIPSGMYDALFIVRQICPERISRSELLLLEDQRETVEAMLASVSTSVTIPREHLHHGLKTLSYVPSWCIDDCADWFLYCRFSDFSEIERLLGVTVDFDYVQRRLRDRSTNLLVSKRLNVAAPGTCGIAFYSEAKVTAPNVFWCVDAEMNHSAALCLWLNSAFSILQLLFARMETEGSWCDLLKEPLRDLWVPSENFAFENRRRFFTLMNEVGRARMPSLLEQFDSSYPERYRLDSTLMELMGFSNSEIDDWLPKVYRALSSEMTLMVEAMRGPTARQ